MKSSMNKKSDSKVIKECEIHITIANQTINR